MIKRMILIFLLLLALLSPANASEWGWESYIVATGTVTTKTDIKVISSPVIGAVYSDGGVIKFVKSSNNGRTWGAPITVVSANGIQPALAIKNSTTYFIAYYDSVTLDAKFAKTINSGATWTISTIESTNDRGRQPSIVYISASGHMYVAYLDTTASDLRYAKSIDDGASWSVGTVDTVGAVGVYPSIDGYWTLVQDALAITYYDTTNTKLKIAYSADSAATWATNDVEIFVLGAPSVPISSMKWVYYAGNYDVFVSYNNGDTNTIKFGRSTDNGATWTLKDILSGEVYFGSSLAVSPYVPTSAYQNVDIMIVMNDNTNGYLRLARSFNLGASWTIEIVDRYPGLFANIPLIGFDYDSSNGNVFVSYFDKNSDFKTARSLNFASYPVIMSQNSGIGVQEKPQQWNIVKDGAVGDNLDRGILAVTPYEWDGDRFQRKRAPAGKQFYAVKRDNVGAASINIPFGFRAKKIAINTPAANTNEICIDWTGGTAVCPAANAAGDDRIPASTSVILDDYGTSSISVIAAAGAQVIYVRAWE